MNECNKKETNDILFEIDMEIYDEFNDKFCIMNENLGDTYSYKDLEELEMARLIKENELLRQAIRKLLNERK